MTPEELDQLKRVFDAHDEAFATFEAVRDAFHHAQQLVEDTRDGAAAALVHVAMLHRQYEEAIGAVVAANRAALAMLRGKP